MMTSAALMQQYIYLCMKWTFVLDSATGKCLADAQKTVYSNQHSCAVWCNGSVCSSLHCAQPTFVYPIITFGTNVHLDGLIQFWWPQVVTVTSDLMMIMTKHVWP